MLFFHIASYAPSQVAYFVASLVLFDIRNKGLFALLYTLCFVASLPMAYVEPLALRMFAGFLLMVGPQLLLSGDRPVRKAFLAALFIAVMMLSEILPTLLWFQITEFDPTSAQAYLYFLNEIIIIRALHVLLIIAMFAGVVAADRRISRVRSDQGVLLCAGFLVAQCALLCLVVVGSETLGHIPSELASLLLVAFVFCLLADAVLFVCMLRYNETVLEEQRVEVLRSEVDQCLGRYQEIRTLVMQVAHLRHDFANHTNTALMLVRQGDLERARQCLKDLSEYARQERDEQPDFSKIEIASLESGAQGATRSRFVEFESIHLSGGGLWLLAARVVLVLSQVILLSVLIAFAVLYGVTPQYVLSVVGAVVLCVASDLVLMRGLRQVPRRNLIAEKSRLLEEQGAAWALQNERMISELEQAGEARASMVEEIEMLEAMLARGEGAAALSALEGAMRPKPSVSRVYCEHEVANAIVSLKAHACESQGIEFLHAAYIPAGVGISDVELCAVLSNMLDNAISGSLEAEGPRRISLKAGYAAGALVVTAENSWAGGEFEPKGKRPSFERKHGWGLNILEELARRHDGSFEAAPVGEDTFRTSIMLSVSSAM